MTSQEPRHETPDTRFADVRGRILRALAVTGAARLRELPFVPTAAEVLKNDLMVQESWFGVWAPAKTPPEVVKKLHAAMLNALNDPELRQQLEAGGSTPAPSASPEAFAAFVKSEHVKWGEVVKLSQAKAD